MNSRTNYLSAFRGSRAPAKPVKPAAPARVSAPQGAGTRMTAKDQARSLGPGAAPPAGLPPAPPTPDAYTSLPADARQQLQAGYGRGGFEGVVNSVGSDWYDIPEWQRTQILSGLVGR